MASPLLEALQFPQPGVCATPLMSLSWSSLAFEYRSPGLEVPRTGDIGPGELEVTPQGPDPQGVAASELDSLLTLNCPVYKTVIGKGCGLCD